MFLFCPFHSDDAFCALLPEVKAQNCETLAAVCQPFCFHQFPGKPVSSTHANSAFYRHMGLFNQWKGVKIGWFHAGTFKSKKTNCKACVFTRRRFFLLQFKVVFLPGSTKSIPNVGKWCFSQLEFRFTRVVSPFRVPEQVGSVTFDHASILVRFNSKTSGCVCVHLP